MNSALGSELGNTTAVSGFFNSILPTNPAALLPQIPPTAVGGLFKSSLQTKAARLLPQIPPTAVGGLFKSSLQEPKWTASPIQLTAVGGIRTRTREGPFCRPDLNNPPTAVGGLRTTTRAGL